MLVNILGKDPWDLFDEFDGKVAATMGSGDVKYHQGFSTNVMTPGGEMHLALSFNPSHLEIVGPVVEGSVRARQDRRRDYGGGLVAPILIHGDAAFAGQGVVMETFQMSQTRGFKTGGTIHIVVNNQVGFTTSRQDDARSTEYCTEIAKVVKAPILHVNGDDPEAVAFAARPGGGLSNAVPQGCGHRHRLLPPPGAQRGRRADEDAAPDVRQDTQAADHSGPLCEAVGRRGDRHRRRSGGLGGAVPQHLGAGRACGSVHCPGAGPQPVR